MKQLTLAVCAATMTLAVTLSPAMAEGESPLMPIQEMLAPQPAVESAAETASVPMPATKPSRAGRQARAGRQETPVGAGGHGQSGMASWYALPGRRTACGPIHNPEAMTAAHRSLPCGTKVQVTHRSTGKSVVVTINDRGPFIRGRIIDLSRGPARSIGLTGSGVAPVQLAVLR